jgi:hypothetical protein
MKFTKLAVLVLVLGLANVSFADDRNTEGGNAAYREAATALARGDISGPLTRSVGNLVAEAADVLRESGQPQIAAKVEADWKKHYARGLTAADFVLGRHGKDDLGDHPPAIQYLAQLYDLLMQYSGGLARQVRLVEDINTLNYALPVVFQPNGDWQSGNFAADEIEYRKHFIPFANIVTYYAALYGCKYATGQAGIPELDRICKPLAERLEWYMGRHVAWKISDAIFEASRRGHKIDVEIQVMALLELEAA